MGFLASTFSNGVVGNEMMMKDTIGPCGTANTVIFRYCTIMLVYGLFKHPKYCVENFNEPTDYCMGWIRTRMIVGVLYFCGTCHVVFLWANR